MPENVTPYTNWKILLIRPMQSRPSYADPISFDYCPFLNDLFLFWAYYFQSNIHSIFFSSSFWFSISWTSWICFFLFDFDSFYFKFFSVPSVYQSFLHLVYLTFPPSPLILRKENHNLFYFFKVYVRTVTSTSFCNLREFSLVTQ